MQMYAKNLQMSQLLAHNRFYSKIVSFFGLEKKQAIIWFVNKNEGIKNAKGIIKTKNIFWNM